MGVSEIEIWCVLFLMINHFMSCRNSAKYLFQRKLFEINLIVVHALISFWQNFITPSFFFVIKPKFVCITTQFRSASLPLSGAINLSDPLECYRKTDMWQLGNGCRQKRGIFKILHLMRQFQRLLLSKNTLLHTNYALPYVNGLINL